MCWVCVCVRLPRSKVKTDAKENTQSAVDEYSEYVRP